MIDLKIGAAVQPLTKYSSTVIISEVVRAPEVTGFAGSSTIYNSSLKHTLHLFIERSVRLTVAVYT